MESPILKYYFCCGPKFLLHKLPRFWNTSYVGLQQMYSKIGADYSKIEVIYEVKISVLFSPTVYGPFFNRFIDR